MGILSNSAGTVAICCLLASIMLALSACNEEQTAPQWRTADVVRTDLTRYATASGLTQAWKTVLIKSEASGEVKTIKVEVGDAVEQGALLVELDPIDAAEQLEKAKAETYVAKVGLTVAESQFKRSKDLLQRKVISRQDFEASELGFAEARSKLVSAQAQTRLAEKRLTDTTIRAPISGIITKRAIERGQIIASGTSAFSGGTDLLEMAVLDPIVVRAEFDEQNIVLLKKSATVEVRLDAFPNRVFVGEIGLISPVGIEEDKVIHYPVEIHVPNPENLLKPGMAADVAVKVGQRSNSINIPTAALIHPQALSITSDWAGGDIEQPTTKLADKNSPYFVLALSSKGSMQFKVVETGLVTPVAAEILSGVGEGESVVLTPSAELIQGQLRRSKFFKKMSSMPGKKK